MILTNHTSFFEELGLTSFTTLHPNRTLYGSYYCEILTNLIQCTFYTTRGCTFYIKFEILCIGTRDKRDRCDKYNLFI